MAMLCCPTLTVLRAPLLWWMKMISTTGNRNSHSLIAARSDNVTPSPGDFTPHSDALTEEDHQLAHEGGTRAAVMPPHPPFAASVPACHSASLAPATSGGHAFQRHRRVGSGASSNGSLSFERAAAGTAYGSTAASLEDLRTPPRQDDGTAVRTSVFGRTMAAKRFSDTGSAASSAMSRSADRMVVLGFGCPVGSCLLVNSLPPPLPPSPGQARSLPAWLTCHLPM